MRKLLIVIAILALAVPAIAQVTNQNALGCASFHNGVCESRGFGLGLNEVFTKPSAGVVKLGGSYNYATMQVGRLTITGIADPSAPTVVATGTTGSTAYGYKVACESADGTTTAASTEATIADGNATLSATNYNAISWTLPSGARQCKVYRTTGGAAQGYIATVIAPTVALNDTGLTANGSAPTINTTGELFLSQFHAAPTAANAACTAGEVRVSTSYIFVCVGTNTWKRAAIATW